MSKNVILKNRKGDQVFPATTLEQVHYEGNMNLKQAIHNMTAHAFTANSADEMTDKTKIYVYTGTGSTYRHGYWYYWSGNAWQPGGEYGALLEVDDIKLGYDGTLHETPGKAVRNQVADVHNKLNDEVEAIKKQIADVHSELNDEAAARTDIAEEILNTYDDRLFANPGVALRTQFREVYEGKGIAPRSIKYEHLPEDMATIEYDIKRKELSSSLIGITDIDTVYPECMYDIRIFIYSHTGTLEDGFEIPAKLNFMNDQDLIYSKAYTFVTVGETAELLGVKIPKNCTRVKIQLSMENAPFQITNGNLGGYKYQLTKIPLKISMPLLEVTGENIKENIVEKKHLSQEVQDMFNNNAVNAISSIDGRAADYILLRSSGGNIFKLYVTDVGVLKVDIVPEQT